MGGAHKYNENIEPYGNAAKNNANYYWDEYIGLNLDDVMQPYYTNILLVEDDPTTANYIKSVIRKTMVTPCRIRSFISGSTAYKYILSLKNNHMPGPDYAIVDFVLNGPLNGLRICRLLEDRFPETQSFLTSSLPIDKIRKEVDESSTLPLFISKPFNPAQLREIFN